MPVPTFDDIELLRNGKVPVVLQNEAAECGLACLAMVASANGYRTSLTELRRRFRTSATGMNLKTLMDIADALGLTSRPVRLELNDLGNLKLPAILHWNMDHFVVLVRARRDQVLIHDPARGRRWVRQGEIDRSFTGVAVEFARSQHFAPRKSAERVRLAGLFQSVRGLVASITQIFLLALAMQLLALLLPVINQLIIDEAITKDDIGLLNVLVEAMILLVVTTAAINMLHGLVGIYLTTQISFQMRTNLLRHVMRLPVSWFEKRHLGDILSRFASLGPVQQILLNAAPVSALNLIIVVTTLGMMAVYAPLLAVIELVGILGFLSIRFLAFPHIRRQIEEALHLDARVQTIFLETIRSIRTFKLFGHERERVAMWQNEQAELVNNQVRLSRFLLFGGTGTTILSGLQRIVIWFLGARMVIGGDLSLGMLFAFQAYALQFGAAAHALIDQVFAFRTMRLHLERLADIVHAETEAGVDAPFDPRRRIAGSLAMDKVSFRYGENDPWILRDASFEIEAGELVCIRGPSGQGKSTLLKLLLGFEDPQEGRILVDGTDLRGFGIRTFRGHVGAVLQDDTLLAGTIAENISFFDAKAGDERVIAAARSAQIHDEISGLPMGYHTLTGDLGSTLSAGQRQRVLLARALYRAPSILLLDEGTANLDPAKEDAIMTAIEALPITRIVVAHRERAARNATRYLDVEHAMVRAELS